MPTSRSPLVLFVALSAALALPAQGRIQDGNTFWSFGTLPATSTPATSAGTAPFNFSGSAAAPVNGYQSWWYYRIVGDPREYAFNTANNQLVQSWSGDTAVLDWQDVDQRGISAHYTIRVYATGASSGVAAHAFRVTNNTASPIQLNLFTYVDLDMCSSAVNNNAIANPTNDWQRITRPAGCPSDFIDFVGLAPDNHEVVGYAVLRGKLQDTVADDLANTGLPFVGDYTAGYQWKDRTLGPGQSLTVHLALAHNVAICQGASDAALYGTGQPGTRGEPVFQPSPPYLGGLSRLTVGTGLPGAGPLLALGFARANVPIPPFGILWVNLRFTLTGVAFDAQGVSVNPIPVPLDVSLCGGRVDFQAFFFDPGAAGLIAHTSGIEWVLGSM